MRVKMKATLCDGFVLLIEIVISLALLTVCAATIAHYCLHTSRTQQDIRQRIMILNRGKNTVDSVTINKHRASTEQEKGIRYTITTRAVQPRIQASIPELETLHVAPFCGIAWSGQWTDAAGTKRQLSLHSGGLIEQEGVPS